MKDSEILRIFAQANRKCGYPEYAGILENLAAVEEAEETLWVKADPVCNPYEGHEPKSGNGFWRGD